MPSRSSWSRGLVIGGLVGMGAGVIDPIEGSFVILAGNLAAATGGHLGGYRRRKLLYVAAALMAITVATMIALTAVGGFGGKSGRSIWWAVTLVPYPVGWVLGIVGAVLVLRERRASIGTGAAGAPGTAPQAGAPPGATPEPRPSSDHPEDPEP